MMMMMMMYRYGGRGEEGGGKDLGATANPKLFNIWNIGVFILVGTS